MPLRTLDPYWQTTDQDTLRLYCGDALKVLRRLPSGVVQTIVTSPPYFGLRDYQTGEWEGGDPECGHRISGSVRTDRPWGKLNPANVERHEAREPTYKDVCGRCGARRVDRQLGSEATPDCGTKGQAQCGECYVCNMTAVFRECRRVLRDDGIFWLNIGDSYSSGASNQNGSGLDGKVRGGNRECGPSRPLAGLAPGNLLGMPWRLAFALQADGWVLRQDIIWAKLSAMPESVQNRCTKSHEYIFLLAKGSGYYYDATAVKEKALQPAGTATTAGKQHKQGAMGRNLQSSNLGTNYGPDSRNKRSVWSVQEDRQLYDWMAEHAPEVLAEFLARNEMRGEEHEYIFLLAKQQDYYYDQEAVKEAAADPTRPAQPGYSRALPNDPYHGQNTGLWGQQGTRIKRSVWTVSHGGGYKGSHFASFPRKLIEPMILAGTSEVGCCPGCGAPWIRILGKTRTVTRPGTDSKAWSAAKPPGRSGAVPHPGRMTVGGQQSATREKLGAQEAGNRDPERHVTETRTLGWRPGCQCYGLELIGDQPSEPHPPAGASGLTGSGYAPPGQERAHSNARSDKAAVDFEERYRRYEGLMAEWIPAWTRLKPLYEEALGDDGEGNYSGTVPCLVMDPFIGSGTTALVCLDKGRRCWGVDLSEEYLREHCVQRVRSDLLGRPGIRHLAAPLPGGNK